MRTLTLMMILAASTLMIAACGEATPDESTVLADPAIGVDEDAACVDPSWYCNYIGGVNTCALGSCGSTNCPLGDSSNQNFTCESGGLSWRITQPLDLHGGGYYPCTITHNIYPNTDRAALPGTPICQADFTHYYQVVKCLASNETIWSYTDTYQDHLVHSDICPSGFVRCRMSRTVDTYWTGNCCGPTC